MTAPEAAPRQAAGPKRYLAVTLFGIAVVIALALVVLRGLLAASYKVPSGGMLPTIAVGEHVLVNKMDKTAARGKVMVFRYPEHPDQDFVKRVVGMPGDKIAFKGTDLFVNDKAIPTCKVGDWSFTEADGSMKHDGELVLENLDGARYLVFHDRASAGGGAEGPWTVKDGEAFVLGDNRENSHDSRMWFGGAGGGVPFGMMRGTVRPQGTLGLPLGAEGLKQRLTACLGSL